MAIVPDGSDILFHVCVDIGTIGTAATFRPIRNKLPRLIEFPLPDGIAYQKIPSVIVLLKSEDPAERTPRAFGYDAQDLYVDDDDESDDDSDEDDANPKVSRDDLLLFNNFKKHIVEALRNPPEDGFIDYDQILIPSDDLSCDIHVPVKEVLSKFIKMVSDYVVDQMTRLSPIVVTEDRIEWVFSVPAMWDEYSKLMIVQCARRAGLTNVKTTMEAECAAAWFLAERDADIQREERDDGIPLARRTRYLLFDCGGGTTDCVYHKIEKVDRDDEKHSFTHFEVSERFPSVAIPSGALMIDEDFERYILEPLFSPRGLARMKEQKPILFLELMRKFSTAKFEAQPNVNRKFTFGPVYHEYLEGTVDEANERLSLQSEGDNTATCLGKIKAKRGRMEITAAGWALIHRRVLADLHHFIADRVAQSDEIKLCKPRARGRQDYVVFTGGFAKSLFLQEHVKQHFGDSELRSVRFFGERPEHAVAIGGLYPQQVCQFKGRAWYGFEYTEAFHPGGGGDYDHVQGDPPNQIEFNLFQTILGKYEVYRPPQVVEFAKFSPANAGSGPVVIKIYMTDSDDMPRYVDDPGCRLALSFDVPISPEARSIEVSATLQPGSIELYVTTDGERQRCQLRLG